MASPFPGMDPFLEDPAFWPDFHAIFISCWREILTDLLPETYEARIDERIHLVQMAEEVVKIIRPDVAVSKGPQTTSATTPETRTLLLEPVTIPHVFLEEVRETRIEILHRPERTLVAVLELLSPWNKTDGFLHYRAQRPSILRQPIHLVELDLLLGGNRLPLLEPLPAGDYYALVTRSQRRAYCEVYSWSVRRPLPTIPIPLKEPDPDLLLDLGVIFKEAFRRGRYERSLRYGAAPPAPLQEEDRAWAMTLVP